MMTVGPRHLVVEHHEVRHGVLDRRERLLAVGRLDDLVALRRQRLSQHPAHVLLVVRYQDALAHVDHPSPM
jgi:hypothetical protein